MLSVGPRSRSACSGFTPGAMRLAHLRASPPRKHINAHSGGFLRGEKNPKSVFCLSAWREERKQDEIKPAVDVKVSAQESQLRKMRDTQESRRFAPWFSLRWEKLWRWDWKCENEESNTAALESEVDCYSFKKRNQKTHFHLCPSSTNTSLQILQALIFFVLPGCCFHG